MANALTKVSRIYNLIDIRMQNTKVPKLNSINEIRKMNKESLA